MRLEATQPIDVSEKKISDLLLLMSKTAFQGRKLGEALKIWLEMLEEKEITIFLGLAGAMVPAGMRKILSFLVRKRYVDVVVSTGANLFHDIHEALGMKHYLGTEKADDRHLYKEGINRIYDIFAYDSEFSEADMLIVDVVSDMNGMYSSREFLETLTKKLKKYIVEDSILVAGLESNVPIFCPGISDSSLGIALVLARKKGANIVVDPLKDVEELTDIVIKSTKTGVVYVSGGLPKNFVQQTEVVAEMLGIKKGGHEYAIQFTTDMPQWGGLSGCTIEEGISWGKINERCRKVQVHVDSTIALPLVSHGLIAKERESHPVFVWGKELELKYATRVVV